MNESLDADNAAMHNEQTQNTAEQDANRSEHLMGHLAIVGDLPHDDPRHDPRLVAEADEAFRRAAA